MFRGSKPEYKWGFVGNASIYDTLRPFSAIIDMFDNDKMWVGCASAHLLEINLKTSDVVVHNISNGNFSNDIYQHVDGKIYSKSSFGHLLRFDPKTKEHSFFDIPNDDSQHALQTIFKSEEEIWIANKNIGLVSFNINNEEFQSIGDNFNRSIISQNENLYSLFNDDQGVLWIGSYTHGLLRLQPNSDFFIHKKLPEGIREELGLPFSSKPVIPRCLLRG